MTNSGAAGDASESTAKKVIAHRGASSYLPEHTLPAYALAHAQGADYIEPDVVLTRDNVLVCLHDLYLETTTDVAAQFPDRKRSDNHYYVADFTLAEIKTLRAFGRVPETERPALQGYSVATLEELVLLVQRLNRKTNRNCGLCIETKDPEFHWRESKPLEQPLLDLLTQYGYIHSDSGAIIQSFNADHLKRLRHEHQTQLPLMWLVSVLPPLDALPDLATWGNGLNPVGHALLTDGKISPNAIETMRQMKTLHLKMFIWTFNTEVDLMRTALYDFGADGVITNNPDCGVRAIGSR